MKKATQDTVLSKKSSAELQKELQETKKNLKSSIMLAVTTLAAILSLCLAWYVNNSEVDTAGVQIQNAEGGFELASVGTDGGYYESLLKTEDLEWTNVWNMGEIITNLLDHKNALKTSDAVQQINWMMSADSNLNNSDYNNSGLYPGASGNLTFYVIPNKAGTLKIKFDLSTLLYQTTDEQDSDAIKVVWSDENQEYVKEISEDDISAGLVSGHILFFETKNQDTGRYSDWIQEGTFTKTFEVDENQDGSYEAIEVTIFWVWPNVVGQMLLPQKAMNLNGRKVLFEDDVRKALCDDMIEANEHYFYNDGDSLSEVTSDLLSSMVSGTYIAPDYTKLSHYYNRADQYIGENVQYMVLRLTARSDE
jgi:hypothetical protein